MIRNPITQEDIHSIDGVIYKMFDIEIGSIVEKHSGKPFKNGKLIDVVVGFEINEQKPINPNNPLNNIGALLGESDCNVCVSMIKLATEETIEKGCV